MSYLPPLADIESALALAGADRLAGTDRFAEATRETRRAVLEEAARLCAETLAPLNRVGDSHPPRLENGVVRTSPGFPEAYAAFREGGWTSVAADPAHGGMGLPQSFQQALNEMTAGACLAFSVCTLLSTGQIEALEAHADDRLKALYLPKLVSGEWTGTMNLTEPQAGTDVGAVRTRAEPAGDGAYRLTGEKIYISWGDHDMAENVVHLVLARLPDAPPGVRGVSLFLAPKRLLREDGSPGERNALRPISLEEKLGLHASPTCVMAYEGATAWLVGEPHKGLAAMFTMMNNARLGVGLSGVGVAEAAFQKALTFARERRQGGAAIVDHADVRRMLMTMRARTLAARAIGYACAVALDMARAAPEAERARWVARGAFLTPIAKAYGTDVGREVADLGIQVHGGMGFVEETGAAQFWRDVRVTAIYEGTNGVQAMDLVGRKLADGGEAARALLSETVATTRDLPGETAARIEAAARRVSEATERLVEMEARDRQAGGGPYLRAWATLLGAAALSRLASVDDRLRSFAEFYATQELPTVAGLVEQATAGAASLDAVSADRLAS